MTWGDQTWEEMAIAFFDVARPRKIASDEPEEKPKSKKAFPEARYNRKITRQTDKFLERFDANGDGSIQRDELPLAIRIKEFNRSDSNRDGRVDREELMDQFRLRLK